MSNLIDGKAIAEKVREEVRVAVAEMKAKHDYVPGLATVLVGEDPASATYVRSKQRTCERLGINSIGHHLPADSTQEAVEALVSELNADPQVKFRQIELDHFFVERKGLEKKPFGIEQGQGFQFLEEQIDGF